MSASREAIRPARSVEVSVPASAREIEACLAAISATDALKDAPPNVRDEIVKSIKAGTLLSDNFCKATVRGTTIEDAVKSSSNLLSTKPDCGISLSRTAAMWLMTELNTYAESVLSADKVMSRAATNLADRLSEAS